MRIISGGGKRYVLFDETNSMIEHDMRDEEFELGLVRKDLTLTENSMVDNGKSPEGETSPGFGNMEGGAGSKLVKGKLC